MRDLFEKGLWPCLSVYDLDRQHQCLRKAADHYRQAQEFMRRGVKSDYVAACHEMEAAMDAVLPGLLKLQDQEE